MKITYLLLLSLLSTLSLQAQTVSITVTDEGQPMAYHMVTISHGDYVLGSGRTNSRGFVAIEARGLRSKSVDVAGSYKNGGTSKEWSIKGKLKLDNRNSLHIQLEKIGEDIEKSKAEMEQRRKDMSERMNKHFGKKPTSIANEKEENGSERKINPNTDFGKAIQEIKATRSSFDKKDLALALVKKQELSTKQIKQVLAEITSAFSQKELAIAAYTNCTDKKNYERVISTLTSKFMQDDVRKATIGN